MTIFIEVRTRYRRWKSGHKEAKGTGKVQTLEYFYSWRNLHALYIGNVNQDQVDVIYRTSRAFITYYIISAYYKVAFKLLT